MAKNKSCEKIPQGAVSLTDGATVEYVERPAEEKYQLIEGVWLVFPSNKNSRAKPIEGRE